MLLNFLEASQEEMPFPCGRLEGKNCFIRFPFSQEIYFIVFQSSPLGVSREKRVNHGGNIAKIIYVLRTTPVALRQFQNKQLFGRAITTLLDIYCSTKDFQSVSRHSNFSFLFFRGKEKTANIFKVKAKDSKNFYFVCFLFSLICV